jgi:hypothetical protein
MQEIVMADSNPKKYENPYVKAGLSILSSAVAEPAAGWAGILSGGSLEAMARTREAMTYKPTDPKAQQAIADVGYAMEPIGIAADDLSQRMGDTVYDATGNATLAGLAHAVPEGIMSLGGLRSVKFRPTTYNPDITPSKAVVEKALIRTLDPFNLHKGANPLEAKMYIGKSATDVPEMTPMNILETGQPGVGWRLAPDGEYRFQISDKDAKFKQDITKIKPLRSEYSAGLPLDEVLDHPELFKQYPDLAKVQVKKTSDPKLNGSFRAYFDNKGNFTEGKIKLQTGRDSEDVMGILLHEIQHWVQTKEGWSSGSSSDTFKSLKEQQPAYVKQLKHDQGTFLAAKKMIEEGWDHKTTLKWAAEKKVPVHKLKFKAWTEQGNGNIDPLFESMGRTKKKVEVLQGLRKSTDGWNYYRTLGEIEARDTQWLRRAEKLGIDLEQYTPSVNRKILDLGGTYEGTLIDPRNEALIMDKANKSTVSPDKLRNI